jgi:glycosyltransferase involved in cell wall biosynthesis
LIVARVALIAGQARSLVNFRGALIEALISQGHSVYAIGPNADSETLGWLADRGVDYFFVPLARASLSPTTDLKTLLASRSALVRGGAEAVIAYTIKAIVYGLLAARIVGLNRRYAMITGLGYAFTDGVDSIKRRFTRSVVRSLYKLSLARAEAVIFQNPDDLKVFSELGLIDSKSRVGIVNGSGVDIGRFQPEPLPTAPVCLMIARLVADKGVGEYIHAARYLKARVPHAVFKLVGPFDPNPAALPAGLLETAIEENAIEYLGEIKDVRPVIATASIFVLPSYREGTPRSALEAMAMGRAVVTTDAPGCREVVEDGVTGLLVPVKSVTELANAILRLIESPELRQQMGFAGRARAVSRYAAKDVAASILKLTALSRMAS